MIELPKEEYTTEVRNGKTYHVCTLRQMVLHTIGLDNYGRPYTREEILPALQELLHNER